MKKENILPSNSRQLNGPITRAAALRASGKMPPLKASSKQDQKRVLKANPKRAALDENNTSGANNASNQRKRRAVLQDVTNVCCENSYTSCFSATKIQAKIAKQAKKGQLNVSKIAPSVALEHRHLRANSKKKITCQEVKRVPFSEIACSSTQEKDVSSQPSGIRGVDIDDLQLPNQCLRVPSHPHNSPKKEKCNVSENQKISSDREFIDIDSDHKDPQLCSLYAADIYSNLRVAEVFPTFMETVQRDITQSMRGILIDWLVEVSEEYKLVPDTLYLTVYLIDRFLSQNYIERQKLQLLGITCMLIASKYEEICSPRVEEFCFITDNTYTSFEVLRMETRVLNFFGFQIFAPTAKTFLRRFLRAAQASYKNPSYELEYLADYLAELTLVDYSFLNFLPSVIAASSVFLSRWTLDQTSHPWSPTLENYTSYKASDLKTTVLAMQDLQLNTSGCPLNAIRMKYRQPKFKSVAALSSPKVLETLF
ncbi:cyclin family protein [Salix suchowensis]|nr:cyclin family protein [Salix suchowensis]